MIGIENILKNISFYHYLQFFKLRTINFALKVHIKNFY